MQSLAEQLPGIELDKNLQDRQRKIDRWLTILAASGISLFVAAILWAIIYKIIILKGEVLEGSLFLVFILGLIAFALLALYGESLKKASSNRQLTNPSTLKSEDTKELAEPHFEPVPSVTERTTELLAIEEKGEGKS
ncbi:MAG: hypothetical protein ABI596_06120 [Pyrinomonadaceae bacterium]